MFAQVRTRLGSTLARLPSCLGSRATRGITPAFCKHQHRSFSTESAGVRVLYDGLCPICVTEIRFLEFLQRNESGKVHFIDIALPDYDGTKYHNVTYEMAMEVMHVIDENDQIHRGVPRPCCFSACVVVLLLGTCLRDVEPSNKKRVIHREVGDTVELSSFLPTEGVTTAYWMYGGLRVADKDGDVSKKHRFKDRVDLNPTSFSLTVRKLALQDSGDFSFISEANNQQRDTVIIPLQVHEPITQQPLVKVTNSTHNALDKSCTILLECSASSNSPVTYNWTVGSKTWTEPKLHHVFKEEDGDTTFTCTVSNVVSEKSTSKTIKCSNDTSLQPDPLDDASFVERNFIIILSVAGGGCLIIVIGVGVAVYVCCCKQRQNDGDINDLTVYADITDVMEDRTTKPCSLYDSINNGTNTAPPGPQTVYDKIQLNRLRKTSVSPYQDVI